MRRRDLFLAAAMLTPVMRLAMAQQPAGTKRIAVVGSSTRRPLLCMSTLIAAIVASTHVAVGADLPFVGAWDCEAKKFDFTEKTYNNGSELLKIKKIKRHGEVYSLLMENGSSISLYDIQKHKMTWHSLKNGDTFECKR
jgi:hypothetical protein